MIYFTSDLHLGHKAVIHMQQRPFTDVDEMNRKIIENINHMVTNADKLYILGDVSHHISAQETDDLVRRIKGKKYLILGNHDLKGDSGMTDYDPSLWVDILDYLKINDYGMKIVLCHYPMLSWHKARAGCIMLHGHIHSDRTYNEGNIAQGIRRYDVGVDANGYFPVPITTIREWAERTGSETKYVPGKAIPGVWKGTSG